MVAARFGDEDVVEALLKLGASSQLKDNYGMNARAYAIKGQSEISNHNSDYRREYGPRFHHVLRLLPAGKP